MKLIKIIDVEKKINLYFIDERYKQNKYNIIS